MKSKKLLITVFQRKITKNRPIYHYIWKRFVFLRPKFKRKLYVSTN
ncbi:hypothetical protein HMPREF9073_01103 [Capnocytophaga sp. oral taxon 326 str. F0382]|nr:hypothetical protein HMPREF9073_01103 [Capnocytophaga sp. oral taxon 326 str. F0382]